MEGYIFKKKILITFRAWFSGLKKLRKLNIEQGTLRDERKRTMEDVEKLIAMINT